jgi:hypothetical protein
LKLKIVLAAVSVAAITSLPACVNSSGKTANKHGGEALLAPSHTPAGQTPPEAEVKSAPEKAPETAAPPASVALPPAPATASRPASPEEQTKATLEPKPVQGAALPQPKSEPATEQPAPPAANDSQTAPAPGAPETATASAGEPAPDNLWSKSVRTPGTPKKDNAAPAEAKPAPAPAEAKAAPAATRTKEAKVAVVGDSLAVGVGMTMSQHIREYQGAACFPLGKVSTGLISKKFYDWEKTLSELVATEKPSAVVVVMGGNDANNPIAGKMPGTPEWDAAYREKAESFLRIATQKGVHVLWVGLPAMRDAAYNKRVLAVNEAAKTACTAVGGSCSYMEASDIFTDAAGKFVQTKTIGGKKVSLRAKDGVHMTMNGYNLLCGQVLDRLAREGSLPATKQ